MTRPFHLAFAVDDLDAARAFYSGVLGCAEGRSSLRWIDFDLFGHQIVAHLVERPPPPPPPPASGRGEDARGIESPFRLREGLGVGRVAANPVDGHDVPVPHFGVVLTMDDWQGLAERLTAADVSFGIVPHIRFEGEAGEQATMFLSDPAGNALEFKAFADDKMIFAKD